ncbi:hypothetical protein [Candidatus Sneabacter namystus]|uniref:DUF3168 domain-containing protein n=1 Tax=Candidatus Sneabacter namystus TaxID=2601646 RepID=A0A5C0UIX9_9RICK|nr:hypothetical protein [Candidatus Sneabacter namystus]QEK39749.1 hypothetical protein FZC37_02310 [Candidatus Sneabacter namystus]
MSIFEIIFDIENKIKEHLLSINEVRKSNAKVFLQQQENSTYPLIITSVTNVQSMPTTLPCYEMLLNIQIFDIKRQLLSQLANEILDSLKCERIDERLEKTPVIEKNVKGIFALTQLSFNKSTLSHGEDKTAIRMSLEYLIMTTFQVL